MKNKIISLSFLIVLFFAFVLRAQETLTNNFIFLLDQGRDMMAVKQIVFDHHLTLIGPYTSLQGVFQGPFYYYLLAVPTFIFKGNPWGSVALMLVLSMAVLIISFFWFKKIFGLKSAFVVLILLTISPEAIASATYFWNPHPMWLLITTFIISFYEVVSNNKKFLYILWPTIFLMFHFQAALAFFIFLGSLIYFLIFERKKITKDFLLGFLIGLLLLSPLAFFELRHNFLMTNSIFQIFSGESRGLLVKGESTSQILRSLGNMDAFYGNIRSAFPNVFPLSLISKITLLLVVLSLFSHKLTFFTKKEKEFVTFISRFVLLTAFMYLFYPFPVRYWHLTGLQVFYIFLFSIFLSKLLISKVGRLLFSVFVLACLFYSIQRTNEIYTKDPTEGGVAKIKGKLEAIDYIYKDVHGKPFNLLVFTPPVNTDAYDYLIWWRGSQKYGYIPGKEKKGIFYLLIEPDPRKPWSYNGWLETVIKSGKIVKTYNHPKGFIIQRREITKV